MADVYQCLAQVNPPATTDTNLITVPAATGYIISSLIVCNQDAVERYCHIRVSHGAGSSSLIEFLAIYERIPPNGFKIITAGICLTAADQINVTGESANMSFSAFGVSQSPIPAASPKLLGQANPLVNTLTDLYTVPGGKSAVLSSLFITNGYGSTLLETVKYRLAISVGGGAVAAKDYLAYDSPLPDVSGGGKGQETSMTVLTLGLTLAAGDKIRVYGNSTNATPSTSAVAFNLFGVEIT